jgi:hypothetical protein
MAQRLGHGQGSPVRIGSSPPDRRELRFDRQAPCDKWMMATEKCRKCWRRLEICEISGRHVASSLIVTSRFDFCGFLGTRGPANN